jgi:tRNA U34 5-methylaminomethyl-2-thiouridine-forming methyltransferase MnmC
MNIHLRETILEREIIQTLDGSDHTIKEWDECYHSKHGAIQAQHVFIKMVFPYLKTETISILEIGFGTGLNAFITYLEAVKFNQSIDYVGVEAYPISAEEILAMNYTNELKAQDQENIFEQMHASIWEQKEILGTNFRS